MRKPTKKEEENIGEESYCWLTTEINIASTEQDATSKKNFFRELKPGVTNKKNKNRNEKQWKTLKGKVEEISLRSRVKK